MSCRLKVAEHRSHVHWPPCCVRMCRSRFRRCAKVRSHISQLNILTNSSITTQLTKSSVHYMSMSSNDDRSLFAVFYSPLASWSRVQSTVQRPTRLDLKYKLVNGHPIYRGQMKHSKMDQLRPDCRRGKSSSMSLQSLENLPGSQCKYKNMVQLHPDCRRGRRSVSQ